MDISKISYGNLPDELNVFIEISQGSSIKYELDKKSGLIFVDRFVYGALFYPFNYGFVPNTHAEDGDPIDVLVVSSYPVQPGVILSSRPIGMLEMEDEEGIDTKIIALPKAKIDPTYADIDNIEQLASHIKDKIKNFFDTYKDLEPNKWVKTKSFLSKEHALKAIKKSLI